jgi:hypothetical protein
MSLLCRRWCADRVRIACRCMVRSPLRNGHRICESHMLSLDRLSHGRLLGGRRRWLRSGCGGDLDWRGLRYGSGSDRDICLLVGGFWRRFRRRCWCWWGSRTTTRRSLRRRLFARRGGADERRHGTPASTPSNMGRGECVVLHGMCRCVGELSAWMQVNANNKVSSPRKNGTSHETTRWEWDWCFASTEHSTIHSFIHSFIFAVRGYSNKGKHAHIHTSP